MSITLVSSSYHYGGTRHEEMARDWIASLDDRASEHGVELHGSSVTPNEHTFYFIMETDTLENATSFLDSPFLEDHDGRIAPVMTVGRAEETLLQD